LLKYYVSYYVLGCWIRKSPMSKADMFYRFLPFPSSFSYENYRKNQKMCRIKEQLYRYNLVTESNACKAHPSGVRGMSFFAIKCSQTKFKKKNIIVKRIKIIEKKYYKAHAHVSSVRSMRNVLLLLLSLLLLFCIAHSRQKNNILGVFLKILQKNVSRKASRDSADSNLNCVHTEHAYLHLNKTGSFEHAQTLYVL